MWTVYLLLYCILLATFFNGKCSSAEYVGIISIYFEQKFGMYLRIQHAFLCKYHDNFSFSHLSLIKKNEQKSNESQIEKKLQKWQRKIFRHQLCPTRLAHQCSVQSQKKGGVEQALKTADSERPFWINSLEIVSLQISPTYPKNIGSNTHSGVFPKNQDTNY